MKLEDIEALEGADLRQLQLYLNDKDKGRVLGNLFRVFTHEGHVKWVCIDHYKENYRKADIQRFEEVVTASSGEFYQSEAPSLSALDLKPWQFSFTEQWSKRVEFSLSTSSWSGMLRLMISKSSHQPLRWLI